MKILLTGASGFVGRHVLDALASGGNQVLALTRQNLNADSVLLLKGDLDNLKSLKPMIIEFQPDAVIHLAWQDIPDYSQQMSRLNLKLSIDFLDFILANTDCNKIITAGSCWEYGKKQGACNESDTVIIKNYFTWAKHALNQYLSIKCAEKGVTLNWFRIFYVYGPGQREGSLIPTLIKSIGESKTPSIKTPMNKNDFVYVGDVAKAFGKAVEIDLPSGIYNLGSGVSVSVYDVCRIVERQLLGSMTISKNVLNIGEKDEIVNFWADMSKTKKALNMFCDTPLEEGIKLHTHSLQTEVYA